jgi:hypothetical protein
MVDLEQTKDYLALECRSPTFGSSLPTEHLCCSVSVCGSIVMRFCVSMVWRAVCQSFTNY